LPEARPLQRGGNDGALPSSNRLVYPVQKITTDQFLTTSRLQYSKFKKFNV